VPDAGDEPAVQIMREKKRSKRYKVSMLEHRGGDANQFAPQQVMLQRYAHSRVLVNPIALR
jgi:hypothetical protein